MQVWIYWNYVFRDKIGDSGKELKNKIDTSWYYLRQLGWLQFLGGNHRKNKVYFKDSLGEAQKPQNMYFYVMLMYQLVQTDMTELYINQKSVVKLLFAFGFNRLQCWYFVVNL